MIKRLTEITKWKNQRWFRKLHPDHKLAWCYLHAQADISGIWPISCLDLIEDLGFKEFNLQHFIDACNRDYDPVFGHTQTVERLLYHNEKFLWITTFFKEVYEGRDFCVNPLNLFAKPALEKIAAHQLLVAALQKGFIIFPKDFEGLMKPYEALLSPSKPLSENEKGLEKKNNPFEGDILSIDININKKIYDALYIGVSGRGKRVQGGKERGTDDPATGTPPDPPSSTSGEDRSQEPHLCQRMNEVFITAYPKYPADPQTDFPAYLQIATQIARAKKWPKNAYLNGKLDDTVTAWTKLVQFSQTDEWFSTRAVSDFNKEFQRLVQKMNKPGKKNGSKTDLVAGVPQSVGQGGFGKL